MIMNEDDATPVGDEAQAPMTAPEEGAAEVAGDEAPQA